MKEYLWCVTIIGDKSVHFEQTFNISEIVKGGSTYYDVVDWLEEQSLVNEVLDGENLKSITFKIIT